VLAVLLQGFNDPTQTKALGTLRTRCTGAIADYYHSYSDDCFFSTREQEDWRSVPSATGHSLEVCTLGNSQIVLSPDFSLCTPVDNMNLKGLQGVNIIT